MCNWYISSRQENDPLQLRIEMNTNPLVFYLSKININTRMIECKANYTDGIFKKYSVRIKETTITYNIKYVH